jgi:hypothetical protein
MHTTQINWPVTSEQRTASKVAGLSGVLAAAVVVFANYRLLNPLLVRGDAAQTANNLIGHQTQVRVALTCFLTYSLTTIIFLTALYVILKPVNRGLALAGAVFRLVFALLWLLTSLNILGALRFLSDVAYLHSFEFDRLQVLARLNLAATFDDYYVGLPFFGLAATVCSYLWWKSGYIPRNLAIFGFWASAFCVVCAFGYLIWPQLGKVVNPYWFDSPMAMFELAVSLWLLFKGLPATRSVAVAGQRGPEHP